MSMKMTMAEFVGLEPCPFCGGEATVTEFNHGCIISCENDAKAWINGKDDVDGHLAHVQSRSKAEAIAAWNTRAEPTCQLTLDGTDGNFGCSECLENIPPLSNYCPNCGAKVVSE